MATLTWEQSLGDKPEVQPWDAFLGTNEEDVILPDQFASGSFRGAVWRESGNIDLPDFALVVQELKMIGKGNDDANEFVIVGRYAKSDSGAFRFVLAKVYDNPDRSSPITDRAELRLEYSEDVEGPDGKHHGPGLVGSSFMLGPDEAIVEERIALWPTSEEERVGGFFTIVFNTPICGVEHTGTFPQWMGNNGAEVRRVQDPAASLGVKSGDIVLALNEDTLPPQKKSLDISKMIKACSRPMEMLVWREVSETTMKMLPLTNLEVVDEDAELESTHDPVSMRETFESMQHTTADLKADMMGEILKKRKSLDSMRQKRKEGSLERTTSFMQS